VRIDRAHEAQEQLAFADVVLLNKTDLVGAKALASVEARIAGISPYAATKLMSTSTMTRLRAYR
jgi:G3E family GTPase